MFKRFQVMDLYFNEPLPEPKEWISAEESKDHPSISLGLFRVKRRNGTELDAYYIFDGICNLTRYFDMKSSRWWDKITREPLYDVTHWGKS